MPCCDTPLSSQVWDTFSRNITVLPAHPIITPALHQLHWLPVRTLVCRSLAGTAPVYLTVECTLVTAAGCRPLWSADNRTCLVKRSRNQFGDHCFPTAGPSLWNSLPEQLQQPDITFGQFKRSSKVFMFG